MTTRKPPGPRVEPTWMVKKRGSVRGTGGAGGGGGRVTPPNGRKRGPNG